jgi:hypothetical protein
MKYYIKAACFVWAAFLVKKAAAQKDPDLGTWNIVNVRVSLTEKWNLWSELQTRTDGFYKRHFYHEVKGGASLNIKDKINLLVGLGQYVTYSPDEGEFEKVINHEFRFWEQFTLNNNIHRLKIEHRYRIEQRWMSSGYRNRFRYRLSMVLPINKPKVEAGTFYLSFFNEIFFTNTGLYFERNRFFSGIGYATSQLVTIQMGWLNQIDTRISPAPNIRKNFFQTSLLFDVRSLIDKREKLPGVMD